ncbi:hypothetical protein [Nocardioides sp. LHG3406-4]|uniref:hypothetical protein n=1 Tax=Nocardioides sp. LHG3406-4 TaxID=2804575 RepID=UPI003CF7B67B
MSKMDGLRAMREARAEQAAARAAKSPAPPKAASRPAARPAEVRAPAGAPASPDPQLCGHRAISGRTCTREHGHTAKSHRYS